jgi:hypothetical protein
MGCRWQWVGFTGCGVGGPNADTGLVGMVTLNNNLLIGGSDVRVP